MNLNYGDTRPNENYNCAICKNRILSNINWKIDFMPARLLYLPYMKVIKVQDLCYKCYDEAKSFTIISHVWGETKLYTENDLFLSGIDWKIPLNNKEKISRIKNISEDAKYIWFDILCMNQDDKNDINKHIPFMGNYYSKANKCIALMSSEFTNNSIEWFINDKWTNRVWTLPKLILPSKVILTSNIYKIELDDLITNIRKEKYLIDDNILSPGATVINHLLENGKKFDIVSCHKLMVGRECMYEEDRIHAMMSILNSKLGAMYGIDIDESFGKLIFEQIKHNDYSFIGWISGKGNNTIGATIFPKINNKYDWYKINQSDYSNVLSVDANNNQIQIYCVTESIVYNVETIDVMDSDNVILKTLLDISYSLDLPTRKQQLYVILDLFERIGDKGLPGISSDANDTAITKFIEEYPVIKNKIHYIKNLSKRSNKMYLIIGRAKAKWFMYFSEYKPQLGISVIQTNFEIDNRTFLWFFVKERGQYLYRESVFLHGSSRNSNYSWRMIV